MAGEKRAGAKAGVPENNGIDSRTAGAEQRAGAPGRLGAEQRAGAPGPGKIQFPPGTMLNPVPAVMVSCGSLERPNIITIAWTGTICSDPAMTYISVRPSRYSYDIIQETGEFTINLVNRDLVFAADFCGVRSGRDVDKFLEQNLTAAAGKVVSCPSIAESPVNLECRVTEVKPLGSHDMFLAEIVAVTANESLLDASGALRLDRAGLVAYNHGHYYGLQREELGRFGYSVMKPKTRKRYEAAKRARRRSRSQGRRK